MYVIKRSGKKEQVSFDKVLERLKLLSLGLDTENFSYELVAQKTIEGIYDGVSTEELDNLSAEIAASKAVDHPDYGVLASRIIVSGIQKSVERIFSKNIELLYNYKDPKKEIHIPLVSEALYKIVQKHKDRLDKMIVHDRDYDYDYFGIKTLMRSYLLKRDGKISETPQQMLLRVSLGIHGDDLDSVEKSYQMLSKRLFTHATPTTITAGTPWPRLSSCFLLAMKDDSIEGIYDTLKSAALISQGGAGIGIHIHNIRSKGSYIRGTGGESNGIVPMLKNFNETARYVDQGGGKRKGVITIYLEPWHADVFDFLDLKKNTGKEELRARDLFYALWIPDLFMKRVKEDKMWSLMDPNVSSGLSDLYGKDFEKAYEKYEKEGKFVKQVRAQDLWFKIVSSQIETGNPYMLYKDAVNERNAQKNLGVIKSSNVCAEICEYSDSEQTGVCNLASIALPKFVKKDGSFDHEALRELVHVIVNNLDKIIDINKYPTKETEYSNLLHRPMGIGVQGFADMLVILKLPFDSDEALRLNREIFETIYYSALEKSNELAKSKGKYKSFDESPASEGILQFDFWQKQGREVVFSGRWNWDKLKEKIKKDGLRNSLFVAQMPTASTSQILGNNESVEPFTSNMYLRRTLSGEFIVINKHLIKDLLERGLWNEKMKHKMMAENGSIQNIDEIPDDLKKIYRTVWEIPQKAIIDQAAARSPFVDQSQSMNIHMTDPTFSKVTSMHFYGWKSGLKTGMYYLRTQAARDAIKFTVNKELVEEKRGGGEQEKKSEAKNLEAKNLKVVSDDDPKVCINCSA